MWDAGERSGDALRKSMTALLDIEPLAATDYASIADVDTFEEVGLVRVSARALVAVKFGDTRLIDNVKLG